MIRRNISGECAKTFKTRACSVMLSVFKVPMTYRVCMCVAPSILKAIPDCSDSQ